MTDWRTDWVAALMTYWRLILWRTDQLTWLNVILSDSANSKHGWNRPMTLSLLDLANCSQWLIPRHKYTSVWRIDQILKKKWAKQILNCQLNELDTWKFKDQVLHNKWMVRYKSKDLLFFENNTKEFIIRLLRSLLHSGGKINCSHLAELSPWWILGGLRMLRASLFPALSFAI